MGATTTTAKGGAVQLNADLYCFGCFCFFWSFVTCAESLRWWFSLFWVYFRNGLREERKVPWDVLWNALAARRTIRIVNVFDKLTDWIFQMYGCIWGKTNLILDIVAPFSVHTRYFRLVSIGCTFSSVKTGGVSNFLDGVSAFGFDLSCLIRSKQISQKMGRVSSNNVILWAIGMIAE